MLRSKGERSINEEVGKRDGVDEDLVMFALLNKDSIIGASLYGCAIISICTLLE